MQIMFGALAPPLTEQLKGCGFSRGKLAIFEANNLAITRLYLHDLLTDGEAQKARTRLMKSIEQTFTGTKELR